MYYDIYSEELLVCLYSSPSKLRPCFYSVTGHWPIGIPGDYTGGPYVILCTFPSYLKKKKSKERNMPTYNDIGIIMYNILRSYYNIRLIYCI